MPAENDQLHISMPSPDDMAGKLGYLAGVVGVHSAAITELRAGLQANVEQTHAVEKQVASLGTTLQGDIAKMGELVKAAHAGIANLANTATINRAQSEKIDAYLEEVRSRQPEREAKEAQQAADMKLLLDHLHEQDAMAAQRAEEEKQRAEDAAAAAAERAERTSKLLKGISALLLLALVGLAGQALSSIHSKYGDAILPYVGWAIAAIIVVYLFLQPRIDGG